MLFAKELQPRNNSAGSNDVASGKAGRKVAALSQKRTVKLLSSQHSGNFRLHFAMPINVFR